jgi:N-acetylglutamate synthase-like GNAT family acetyltransferase
MTIRLAKIEDTNAIVQLLKESLGETLLKKTTTIWNYKNHQNPFGESPVLLAEENGQIIGVRAFMQWQWQDGNTIWQAYRAVDTATHPNHQRKGIFTKLTLLALENVGISKKCFVFNTPNEKSRPGYLKMGWVSLGKINIKIIPTFLYGVNYLFSKDEKYAISMGENQSQSLCEQHNERMKKGSGLFTPKSVDYLNWRYRDNPIQSYEIISGDNWYIAMHIKKHTYYNELRISEVLGADSPSERKQIRKVVTKFALQNRCLLIITTERELFSLGYFGAVGPILTCRDLTENGVIVSQSRNEKTWQYALGDLELF